MESKLEAFEMWAYRNMLRVLWTDHKTNNKFIITNNKEKKMPVFWTRNKSEVAQYAQKTTYKSF